MFAPSRFPGEREKIPATHTNIEVLEAVQQYLKTATHRGYSGRDEEVACWAIFKDTEIEVRYLGYGSWLTNAWYDRVRYYWRVDDETMKVLPERWWEPVNLTIEC